MPAPGLDLAAAEVSVTWRAPGVHQALALVGDEVWCWSFAAADPEWAAVAGTFRTPVDAAERAALTALTDEPGHGSTDGPVLLLGVGPRIIRIPAARAGRVGAATAPLLVRALTNPVAAVRLQAGVVTPPGAAAAVLGLRFTSVGTAPATLRLAADRVRLAAADGAWQVVPAPTMGLLDADGKLLDGLYAQATVPAGTTAAWVVATDAAAGADRVLVDGTVIVAGPVPPVTVPFALVGPLGELG